MSQESMGVRQDKKLIEEINIQERIFSIRGQQVMIDRDLAFFYEIQTKRLNEQMKRNKARFPNEFCFQLTQSEKDELVAKCDRLNVLKYSSYLPYVFTEQGVAMLSTVIKNEVAIKVSIKIINAFVSMRRFILSNSNLFSRIENLERKQIESDEKIDLILSSLESKNNNINQGVFFNGQIFDAYHLVSDIIKTANKTIRIIDNYIDDSVLNLLLKRERGVDVYIYSDKISQFMMREIQKHNQQYPKIKLIKLKKAHDRFVIIDDLIVYHFGASLKDLGKKWFAFSRLENDGHLVIQRLIKN